MVGLLAEPFQQDARDPLHPGNVVGAFAVADLHDLTEDAEQDLVVFLAVVELLGYHGPEPPLAGVEPGDVGNTAVDDAGVEGAADVVRSAQLVGTADGLGGVLAGDHHDGEVFEQALRRHPGQHIKAVHVGHHDVQQQDGKLGAACIQDLEALCPIGGFQNFEIIGEDLGKDVPVHGRVVHDKDRRAVGVPGADGVGGDVLGDDGVLAALGKIHPLIGYHHCVADGDVCGHHAADAGRELQLAELGQVGRGEALADVPELLDKMLGRDIGQDEQQLVAAVPHQHISGADAAVDDRGGEPERRIARRVAEGVVAELEVVKVDHGDTGVEVFVLQLLLIKAAVVSPDEGVRVELLVGVERPQGTRVQRKDHLDNGRLTVDLDVTGDGLIELAAHRFQLGALAFSGQRFTAHTAGAGVGVFPRRITGLLR